MATDNQSPRRIRYPTLLDISLSRFQHVPDFGFHRSPSLKDDVSPAAEAKRHVFWSLYTIDKNISLNIGFTSHFQDHDIDADLFKPSGHPSQRPWDLMALVTVEFAAIQGRVFDQLYSVGAINRTDEQRAAAVQQLSLDLIAVRDRLVAVCPHSLSHRLVLTALSDRRQLWIVCRLPARNGRLRRLHCLLSNDSHLSGAVSAHRYHGRIFSMLRSRTTSLG